jgi:phospholipase/carboxylesterase
VTDIDPHADEPIATAGAPPEAAEAAVVLLHGRGDSPAGILRLVDDLYHRGVRYIAPAAAGRV